MHKLAHIHHICGDRPTPKACADETTGVRRQLRPLHYLLFQQVLI